MIVHWATFLPALALLLIPITLFHGPKVRYRGISHDWRNIWPQAFGLGLHAIDFCRAILGAWLLLESLTKGHATGFMRYGMPITFAAVLLTAVISQMTFRAKLDTMHAPFAFIAGLVFGFYPTEIAAYTLLLAVVTALGDQDACRFFPGPGGRPSGRRLCVRAEFASEPNRRLRRHAAPVALVAPFRQRNDRFVSGPESFGRFGIRPIPSRMSNLRE